MFDRVLLILLLLLLPLGIVVSRLVTGELSVGKSSSVAAQDKKIETIMEKLNQGNVAVAPSQGDFSITGVAYASDSGVLKIAGVASQPNLFVWVWTAATNLKNAKTDASATASAIKLAVWNGPMVIRPAVSGVFGVEVETKQYTGIVEVRLEQGKSATTIRYDLDKQVQLN